MLVVNQYLTVQVTHYFMKTMHNNDNLTYEYVEGLASDQCYGERNSLTVIGIHPGGLVSVHNVITDGPFIKRY